MIQRVSGTGSVAGEEAKGVGGGMAAAASAVDNLGKGEAKARGSALR